MIVRVMQQALVSFSEPKDFCRPGDDYMWLIFIPKYDFMFVILNTYIVNIIRKGLSNSKERGSSFKGCNLLTIYI